MLPVLRPLLLAVLLLFLRLLTELLVPPLRRPAPRPFPARVRFLPLLWSHHRLPRGQLRLVWPVTAP